MTVNFRKMHGAGNDFVVLDARLTGQPTSWRRAMALADRATGIGCDQVITLLPPQNPALALAHMQIQNPDGSTAGACGNATRCVADLLAAEHGLRHFAIETIAGILPCEVFAPGDARVGLGVPKLDWRDIPLADEADTLNLPLAGDPAACSMGNPHVTFFVDDLDNDDVIARGKIVQENDIFSDGVNAGFAKILSPTEMRLKVFERGAGLTRACGSGACAAVVNACRRGLAGHSMRVILDGGVLHIDWQKEGVFMRGPAVTAFTGQFEEESFPP
jgi:diaminopimelate epimerase